MIAVFRVENLALPSINSDLTIGYRPDSGNGVRLWHPFTISLELGGLPKELTAPREAGELSPWSMESRQ